MDASTCPACGRPIPQEPQRTCPQCGAPLSPPSPFNSVPFEDPSLPFFGRLVATIKLAFTDPVRLFSSVSPEPAGAPVAYGVLIGTVASALSLIWQMGFGNLAMMMDNSTARDLLVSNVVLTVFFFLSPFLCLVGLFLSSGIYHLMLLLVGDGERGFWVTFRAQAYGQTPWLLGIVPLCGGIAGGIWALVLIIVGAKVGHGTATWKAVLAYFIPLLACCLLIFVLASMFGLLGALAALAG